MTLQCDVTQCTARDAWPRDARLLQAVARHRGCQLAALIVCSVRFCITYSASNERCTSSTHICELRIRSKVACMKLQAGRDRRTRPSIPGDAETRKCLQLLQTKLVSQATPRATFLCPVMHSAFERLSHLTTVHFVTQWPSIPDAVFPRGVCTH
jgi:hypothetical protein